MQHLIAASELHSPTQAAALARLQELQRGDYEGIFRQVEQSQAAAVLCCGSAWHSNADAGGGLPPTPGRRGSQGDSMALLFIKRRAACSHTLVTTSPCPSPPTC